jgi:hypothetical protein
MHEPVLDDDPRVDVTEEDGRLTLRYRRRPAWASRRVVAAGFLVAVAGATATSWALMGLGLVAIGAWVAAELVESARRTELCLEDPILTIRRGPWREQVAVAHLVQLYVAEEPGRCRRYALRGMGLDGSDVALVRFPDPDSARRMEKRLERALGLTDRPVSGEIPRGSRSA